MLALLTWSAVVAFQRSPSNHRFHQSFTHGRSSMIYSTMTSEQEIVTSSSENHHVAEDEQPHEQKQEGSKALESILGNAMSPSDFFRNVWQQKPLLFTTTSNKEYTPPGDGTFHDDKMRESPLKELTRQGWHVLVDLLERGPTQQDAPELALVMKDRKVQNREECFEKYGSTLFGPYLDGCSVVQNHADLISPWIAAFCQDLQKSFPHVYVNTYLTPPNSQAMNPHADDREVFVVQLCGSKNWQVFEQVPVAMPYPHEQVGKNGLQVPSDVLEGPRSIATTLEAGDVLYIPRGHVHQAHCTDSLSFHVTIAIATFDWTLAGMLNVATNSILTKVEDYRKGILPSNNPKEELQAQIDSAIQLLQEQVTADAILNNLHARIDNHVQRATPIRMKQIERGRLMSKEEDANDEPLHDVAIGRQAAQRISLTTRMRAATPEEQAQVHTKQGLLVRREMEEDLQRILSNLQSDSSLECRVSDLKSLLTDKSNPTLCDLALLGLAKRAVELGELAIV